MSKPDDALPLSPPKPVVVADDSSQPPSIIQKVVDRVRSLQWLISVICYLAGLLWLLGAAHPRLISRTYFSENALLPGLVDHEFDDHRHLSEMFLIFDSAGKKQQPAYGLSLNNSDEYLNLLQREFADVDLRLDRHEFSFSMPFMHSNRQKSIAKKQNLISGTNLYGILRSQRSPGLESFIIATKVDNAGGLAVMHALARLFTQKHYWAKDIIFLVTDSLVGAEAWMQAYYDMHSPFTNQNFIRRRSGMIQTGIVLDVPRGVLSHVDLQFTGHTGQFTNLDFVNVAVRLCEQEQLDVGFAGILPHAMRWKSTHGSDFDQMLQEASVLARLMQKAASCNATNMHGMFLKYNVQALTLYGVPSKTSSDGNEIDYSLYHYARAVEGIARVQNNIIQKLYRSFFFYLLSSPNHYVPIGYYMPAVALLLVPLALKAIFCWLDATPERAKRFEDVRNGSLLPGLKILCAIYFVSIACYQLVTAKISCSVDFMLAATLIALNLAAICLALIRRRLISLEGKDLKSGEKSLFNCAVCLHAGIVIAVLSMLNFSLGFFVALVAVPVTMLGVLSNQRQNCVLKCFTTAVLVLANPCILSIFVQIASEMLLAGNEEANGKFNLLKVLENVWSSATQHLIGSFAVGSGLFPITYVLLWPLWLSAWTVNAL